VFYGASWPSSAVADDGLVSPGVLALACLDSLCGTDMAGQAGYGVRWQR